jgi:hypothetical protein
LSNCAPARAGESWLRVRRHFHSYSFRNQVLIAFQHPGATRVAGFRRWLDLGYAVRKGERGISILTPCPPSKKRLREWREAGADPDDKPRTFFRLVKVFDRSQVDPLPDFPGGVPDLSPPAIFQPIEGTGLARFLLPLQAFASSIGYSFVVEPTPASVNGYCSPREQKIAVQPVSERYSPNAQLKTGIHEVSHALLHVDNGEDDPKLRRDEEEVVVECVAYSSCSSLGLDTSGFSVPYMASWGNGEEIGRYGELIDRLATRIEDALLLGRSSPQSSPEPIAA